MLSYTFLCIPMHSCTFLHIPASLLRISYEFLCVPHVPAYSCSSACVFPRRAGAVLPLCALNITRASVEREARLNWDACCKVETWKQHYPHRGERNKQNKHYSNKNIEKIVLKELSMRWWGGSCIASRHATHKPYALLCYVQ